MARQNPGPLSGIRVLDVGTNLAGPLGATLMGEFGAEVIKIELPKIGDTLRHLPPHYNGKSLNWVVGGRNKKSITLDLRKEKGAQILRLLVKVSDVLVESFRLGVMEKWRLGYEELQKINPGIIMVRATGFGQDGPYSPRSAFDRIGGAMGGMTYLTGYPDSAPVRVGLNICDQITGIFNALGTVMALYDRDLKSKGQGQWIDVSLYESIFRLLESVVADYHKLGLIRERVGNANEIVAPAENFETQDGKWVCFVIVGEKLFHHALKIMDHLELLNDPRFQTNNARVQNREALHSIIKEWFKKRDYSEIHELFLKEGMPFSLVYSIKDIFDDPHYIARQNIIEINDPQIGPVKMQNVVPKLSRTPGAVSSSAPELGEHNEEVYGNLLGFTKEELKAFREEGVI